MNYSTRSAPFLNESDEVYFASGAWGSTDAKRILRCPAEARDYRDGIMVQPDTEAFRRGRMWDAMLTLGRRLDEVAHVRPAGLDLRTAAGKAWKAEHADESIPMIAEAEADAFRRMQERVPDDVAKVIDACRRYGGQLVMRVPFPGWAAQVKLDLWDGGDGVIYDVKTTSKPLESFVWSARDYGYDVQAGWYRVVTQMVLGGATLFRFIVTETVCPWRTAIFDPTAEWISAADAKADRAAELIGSCVGSGSWPGGSSWRILDAV